MAPLPSIVLSSGEPAGIGPDICLMLARGELPARLAVLADPGLLQARARQLGIDVRLVICQQASEVAPHRSGALQVLPIPLRRAAVPGVLEPANAAYVLEQLQRGTAICVAGEAAALVTAPVQKSVINQAGVPFSGHTEYLAELTGAALPVMMLASEHLRVALVTTHLPLRQVPDAIDRARIEQVIEILDQDLRRHFGIAEPLIHVLGLNPHAGESGLLGDEEQSIIGPAIQTLRQRGYRLAGPIPADTAFTRESLGACDAVLAMYHDQGLPVIKAVAFGEVVNVTLGLPILRTSVDHGTALSLAGTGRARAASLHAAVELAIRLAHHRAEPCSVERVNI
jgi:4-hydroxythreonine-4-phosphate dehydrogenase